MLCTAGELALEIPDRGGSVMDDEMCQSWLVTTLHTWTLRDRNMEALLH